MALTAQLQALAKDESFVSAPSEIQTEFLISNLDTAIPDFKTASPQDKSAFVREVVLPELQELRVQSLKQPHTQEPGVSFNQGISNIGKAIGQGLGNTTQALANPQTYLRLASQAAQAWQTQAENTRPFNFEDEAAIGMGALKGTRDLLHGVLSIPADIQNAYMGQQAASPAISLPEVQSPLLRKYPVSGFIGEQAPFVLPFVRTAKVASQLPKLSTAGKIGQLTRETAINSGIGALYNGDQGLAGRSQNAALGGSMTLGTAAGLYGLGKGIQSVKGIKPEKQNGTVRLPQIQPDRIEQPVLAEPIPQPPLEPLPTQPSIQRMKGRYKLTAKAEKQAPVTTEPMQVDPLEMGAQKLSRFANKTMQESPSIAPEVKAGIQENAPTYKTVTNKGRVQKAQQAISEKGQLSHFTETLAALRSGTFDSQVVADAQVLMMRLQKEGQFEAAIELASALSPEGSKAGQYVQAFSLLNKLTPAGWLYKAQKLADKVNKANPGRKLIEKALDKDINKVTEKELEGAVEKVVKQKPPNPFRKVVNQIKKNKLNIDEAFGVLQNLSEKEFGKYFDGLKKPEQALLCTFLGGIG